ncbi:ParB/RepB/Spo0J family partition protein [soil metagenome]
MSTEDGAGGDIRFELPLDRLRSGRFQPRRRFPEDALATLAASIRAHGVLQPVVVRPAAEGTYEIVAGERRWRAAQLAGLEGVPVIVRETSDSEALSLALIENLQREDLNPLEQARALQQLAEEFGLTHQAIADTVGRSRSAVSNLVRLLDLHPDVQARLAAGELEVGHARALLGLERDRQNAIAKRVVDGQLSVREVEALVRQAHSEPSRRAPRRGNAAMRWLQQALSQELGRQVTIRSKGGGRRSLAIEFGDLEQLEAALHQLESLVARLRESAGPRQRRDVAGSG